jgi:hypothetical protein
MKKKRLNILLGAGASVKAGLPSTPKLTELIVQNELRGMVDGKRYWYQDPKFGTSDPQLMPPVPTKSVPPEFYSEDPIYKQVYDSLSKRFESPNFEHILAALDELQSLAQSQEPGSGSVDKFIHILSPFVEVDPSHPVFREWRFLMYARSELLRIISRQFQHSLASLNTSVFSQFKSLFEALSEQFRLSVFTLNYDDLVERTELDWFDGFTIRGDNCHRFDRTPFLKNCLDAEHLICHLHGSIYFAYDRSPSSSLHGLGSLVRYDTPELALQTLEGVSRSEANDMGTLVDGGPIITGFHKVAKLNLAPAPYGYYYKALSDLLLEGPRLLVIGYGGMDNHVNTWLREFVIKHGDSRKVVYVTPCWANERFEQSPLDRIFADLAQKSNVIESISFEGNPGDDEFFERGHLAICANGFPFLDHARGIQSAIRFLS